MHYEIEVDIGSDGQAFWSPRLEPRDKTGPARRVTFDSLGAARAYIERHQPELLRIVQVTDDGTRKMVLLPTT